jgi:uncharacterized protein (TIGR02145 family)
MKEKRSILLFLFILPVVSFFLDSCKKDNKVPELFTTEISAISQTTALCGGFISLTEGKKSDITERGVCWSLNPNPTISDDKTSDGTGSGGYTSQITGLTAGTTYYVCAYATNSIGTAYGNIISFTTMQQVTDFDGNVYHTIKIGTQIWMAENLKATHYRNGSLIQYVMDNTTWSNLLSGAYCDYNNDITKSEIYGKLYNWYAVHDSRNIAPLGWHVASFAEWETLISFLGGSGVAGGKLKETGFIHWTSPNTGASNETGFSALPGGQRDDIGSYLGIGNKAYWWTSTELITNWPGYASVSFNSGTLTDDFIEVERGLSVRCIKD